jgi:molybdate transport system substrate-binding protein
MSFLGIVYTKSSSGAQGLIIFAGSASRPPLEEAVKLFQKKTGIKVYVTYGGSGYVLSQMILSKRGDIYFPGSSDYMEKAKREGYVYPETEKKVVYLVPAINVQRGNPKNIKSLKDLLRPGLKVAIANPEVVCVGIYAVEILEKNLTPEERTAFRRNLVTYTESCSKTATAVSLKTVDAVIGWRIFEHWDPERIETIPFDKSEIARIGYIPIAISKFTKNRKLAQKFINFILSQEVKDIFKKYHYFMSPQEAFAWIGEEKPIGGEYTYQRSGLKNEF